MAELKDWIKSSADTLDEWSTNRSLTYDRPSRKYLTQEAKDLWVPKPGSTWKKDWDSLPTNWEDKKDKKTVESVKKEVEVFREIDESEYLVITPKKIKEEIGDLNDEILDRMSDIVFTCINCGFKDIMVNFLARSLQKEKGTLECPNCSSEAVGIPEERSEIWIAEILKGK